MSALSATSCPPRPRGEPRAAGQLTNTARDHGTTGGPLEDQLTEQIGAHLEHVKHVGLVSDVSVHHVHEACHEQLDS